MQSETATYISTRGGVPPLSFAQAVLMGLADDGGLLLPAAVPDVRSRLDSWRTLAYPELACEILQFYVGDALEPQILERLVRSAYARFEHPDVVPVRSLGSVHVLELFHGPTLAFKDVALQFLGNLFEHLLSRTGGRLNILGATSGDTGSAAIHGVRGKERIHIFVMHPHQRVSRIQELQMTTVLDANVHNLALTGTFDACQAVLKQVFNDLEFKREFHLGAVNSVNWARVLAQIVYYFYGAFRVQERSGASEVQVCVPTGNFGNIFAGYMARRMGAPIRRLILATNENDILSRFFATGVYQRGEVQPTLSPSMDIQVASNFERYLFYRAGEDPDRVRKWMEQFAKTGRIVLPGADPAFAAGRGGQDEALEVMARYWRDHHWLPDPHTAVGLAVAERFLQEDLPTLCLATAHPAKFPEAARRAVPGLAVRHPNLETLENRPTRCTVLPAEPQAVKAFIREVLR